MNSSLIRRPMVTAIAMRLALRSRPWWPSAPAPASIAVAVAVAVAVAWLPGTAAAQSAPPADDDDAPTVVPYRPSVSTPAALSAPGWLEVESGFLHERADDPTRLDNINYALKLAFTPDWGIRVGGDAFISQRNADGSTVDGIGDTSVILKRRFEVDDASAFGAELGVKLPTARNALGSGHADLGLNTIYSADFLGGAWHTDLNLGGSHLGGAMPLGVGAWQVAWAASLSHVLDAHWGVTGEFSGTHENGVSSTAQFLLAGNYNVSKALVLDAGLSKGLNNASGLWQAFFGATFLTAKLF